MAAYEEVLSADAHRDEWLSARKQGVSASDIAAVLGISPWESPASLWHRKRGDLDDVVESDEMLWGTLLEPVIADRFASQHPEFKAWRFGLVRSTERPWQLATPDRVLYEDSGAVLVLPGDDGYEPVAVLEVKTAYDLNGWGEDGTDEIPVHYRAQVLWQMDVLGLRAAFVAVLVSGHTYREYELTYDSEDVRIMRQAGEAFWRSVVDGERPPLDAHDATTAALKQLHPDIEDRDVVVEDELADEYQAAREAYDAAEARKKLAENRLREAIGDGRRAVREDGTKVVTRSVFEQASFSSTRLRQDRPALYEQYSTQITINKLVPPPKPKAKKEIRAS